ncbi:MAG TPA: hypothetical protein VFG68_15690 [Fimbriiglobus sp.]|nr:hypothetical protein [Fimbriiglobus sp.]
MIQFPPPSGMVGTAMGEVGAATPPPDGSAGVDGTTSEVGGLTGAVGAASEVAGGAGGIGFWRTGNGWNDGVSDSADGAGEPRPPVGVPTGTRGKFPPVVGGVDTAIGAGCTPPVCVKPARADDSPPFQEVGWPVVGAVVRAGEPA